MENFSYYWFCIVFCLLILSAGIDLRKAGTIETRRYTIGYSLSLFFFSLIFIIVTGLALLWWPK